jgi:glucokinase-like ROK family protein
MKWAMKHNAGLFGTSSDRNLASSVVAIKKHGFRKKLIYSLYCTGNMSIPELGKVLNISMPSVVRIIKELTEEGIISEQGAGPSIGGRKPVMYGLTSDSRYTVGIDISQNSVRMAVMNLLNQPVGETIKFSLSLENAKGENANAYMDILIDRVHDLLESHNIPHEKLLGAGIAIPGLQNPETGVNKSHLTSFGRPLREEFEARLNLPVFIDNDARLMALGEYRFGLAQGKKNALCLNVGVGVGMGMILNGRLYQGSTGYAGELGHIRLLQEGILCYCGKEGCLETVTGGPALERLAHEGIDSGVTTSLKELKNDTSRPFYETIIQAALKGDSFAIGLLDIVGQNLGKGLANMLHIFNPEIIIIGGTISKSGRYITDPIQQSLNRYAIEFIRRETELSISQLEDKAGLLGAHALVMAKVFRDFDSTPNP